MCWDNFSCALELGVLRLQVSWETSSKANPWVDRTKHCAAGNCQSSAQLALPTVSLIQPCAHCLPPASSALVTSQNWAPVGQDSHE